ncbi:MAG: hypothetical protein WAQ53_02400 [Thiofilum sp.]|uniref:hypothetical protein n=1 Tax=Thiofilum sp. TaxID=2212733 RepID=UPI0025E2CF68|nr:hypothetical protein [Thiofilum sp.]MBK8454537.1 hypothetical protein [Thiofilum sp.]
MNNQNDYTSVFEKAQKMVSPINDLLKNDAFLKSCIDKLSEEGTNITFNENVSIDCNNSGIYLFWISFKNLDVKTTNSLEKILENFLNKWDNPEESISYFPKSNKERSKSTSEKYQKEDWIPFYLGKSENIGDRIHQHLYIEPNKKTYALKLMHRKSFSKKVKFKINYLSIKTTNVDYFLVERVELFLRDKLFPIIGKQ